MTKNKFAWDDDDFASLSIIKKADREDLPEDERGDAAEEKCRACGLPQSGHEEGTEMHDGCLNSYEPKEEDQ